MAFGDKKQPEMFEAFRQSKGDQPEDAKPKHPQPSGRPLDLKPPVPTAGNIKPPVKPSGQRPKPVVPVLQEAKAVNPSVTAKSAGANQAGPVTAKPAGAKPEPKLFDDKPAAVVPKPTAAPAPSAAPSASEKPVAPKPVPAPAPVVHTPAPAPSVAPIPKPVAPIAQTPAAAPAPAPSVAPIPKPVAQTLAPSASEKPAAAPSPAPSEKPKPEPVVVVRRPVLAPSVSERPAPAPAASAAPASAKPASPGTAGAQPAAKGLGGSADSLVRRSLGEGGKDLHVVEFGKKPEVVFGLSYSALITAIVVAAAALIIIIGIVIALARHGKGTTTPPEAGKTESGKTEGTGSGAVSPPEKTEGAFPAGTRYTVIALTVSNDAARVREVTSVVDFLKTQCGGQPVLSKANRTGTKVSVFVGAFAADKRADAEALMKRVQKMIYHGRYEFNTAQVLDLTK